MLLCRHPTSPAPLSSTVAMMNKVIGDWQLRKKEALKLRKQLDLLIEEDSDTENTDVRFQNCEVKQHELSLKSHEARQLGRESF